MIIRLAIAVLLLFCTVAQSWRPLQFASGAMACCNETDGAHSADNSAENVPCGEPNASCCFTNACYQAIVLLPSGDHFTTTALPADPAQPIADLYYRQRPLLASILRPPIA